MNADQVRERVQAVSERRREREEDLQQYSTIRDAESDDEGESLCPVLNSFFEKNGNRTLVAMSNFIHSLK